MKLLLVEVEFRSGLGIWLCAVDVQAFCPAPPLTPLGVKSQYSHLVIRVSMSYFFLARNITLVVISISTYMA